MLNQPNGYEEREWNESKQDEQYVLREISKLKYRNDWIATYFNFSCSQIVRACELFKKRVFSGFQLTRVTKFALLAATPHTLLIVHAFYFRKRVFAPSLIVLLEYIQFWNYPSHQRMSPPPHEDDENEDEDEGTEDFRSLSDVVARKNSG